MTIACLALSTGYALTPGIDRGLSDEARTLRNLVMSAWESENSISLGERKRAARSQLAQAFAEAWVEDWDDMGSAAAEPSTYAYASQFLDLLPSSVPIPEIAVDRDGEMYFEWYRGPRLVFTVCVGRDGTLTYAGLFGYNKSHGVELLGETLPRIISTNIERVSSTSASGSRA